MKLRYGVQRNVIENVAELALFNLVTIGRSRAVWYDAVRGRLDRRTREDRPPSRLKISRASSRVRAAFCTMSTDPPCAAMADGATPPAFAIRMAGIAQVCCEFHFPEYLNSGAAFSWLAVAFMVACHFFCPPS